MNQVIETIRSRRSIRKMREDPPTREQIEQILEASTWAPNHFLTEPWRFVVISGEERKKLGDVLAQAVASKMPQQKTEDPEQQKRDEEQLRAEREKPLSAPVIIAAIFSPRNDEAKIVQQEELVAAGAALQNLLLAAHSLGLGAIIRTGKQAYAEQVRSYLGIREKESLLGLVFLGYPSEPPRPTKRTPIDAKVQWRGL